MGGKGLIFFTRQMLFEVPNIHTADQYQMKITFCSYWRIYSSVQMQMIDIHQLKNQEQKKQL